MALYDAYEAYVNLDSSALKDAGVDCSDDDDDDLLLLLVYSTLQLNSTNHPKRKEWFTRGKKL